MSAMYDEEPSGSHPGSLAGPGRQAAYAEPPAPDDAGDDHPLSGQDDEAVLSGTPVTVRRNAGLAALIGGAASAMAIAYLWRATETLAALDWAFFAGLALLAAYHLTSLLDARTPLVVADDLGVRIRLGRQWRGLPWDAVAEVGVLPRRTPFGDGRLVFRPHSLARALEGLEPGGLRAARMNRRLYGGALAVPIGLTTRTSGGDTHLAEGLDALARGRAAVVLERLHGTDDRDVDVREPADLDIGDETATPGTDPAEASAADGRTEVGAGTDGAGAVLGDDRDASDRPGHGVGSVADEVAATSAPWDALDALDADGAARSHAAPESPAVDTASDTRCAAGPDAAVGAADPAADPVPAGPAPAADGQRVVVGRALLGGLGMIVSRVAKGRSRDTDVDPADLAAARHALDGDLPDDTEPGDAGDTGDTAGHDDADGAHGTDLIDGVADRDTGRVRPGAVAALRAARPAARAEVTRDSAPAIGAAALHPDRLDAGSRPTDGLPERDELRRSGHPDHGSDHATDPALPAGVRPIARLGDPVAPLVIDDFVTEPALDPVIGPQLAAARTRVGLSVDELADRTRIRPHVIEAIEVDDFAPSGGDFYARGHLRTLARVLGQDPQPLLSTFDHRYASAPISPRRVFEAELATGRLRARHGTAGSPRWGLMVGMVLALVMAWGLVRLFEADPEQLVPAPVLNGSPGLAGAAGADQPAARDGDASARPVPPPMSVVLVAGVTATDVVVRDGDGTVVHAGELVLGERKRLRVTPPMTVQAGDAGAVTVRIGGRDRGPVGELGEPGRRTFTRTTPATGS